MANKKFSEFVLKTSTSDVSHIVGYNGAENVQITPANFVTSGGTGVFLPLAGGTLTGALTGTSATFNGNVTLGNVTTNDHTFNGQVTQITGDVLGYKLQRSNGTTSMLISSTSDARLEFGTDNGSGTNTAQWSIGKDGTDNSFRISNSASLGTSDTLTLTGANATFSGSVKLSGSTSYILNNDNEVLTGSDAGGYYFGLVTSANSSKALFIGDHNIFMRFDTDGSEKMRLNSSGELGIGTTTPGTLLGANYGTTKLQIDGGSDRGQLIIEGDSFAGIVLSDNGATANERVFAVSVDSGKYQIKPLNDNGTSSASQGVILLHNGNLGVGTSTPAYNITIGNASASDFILALRGGVGGFFGWSDSTNKTILQAPNTRSLSLRVNSDTFGAGTEALLIDSSGNSTFGGNVLINKESNPTSLQIGSNLTDDPFMVFQTDGNTMSMGIDRGDSNKFKISDNATLGTNDRLTIDSIGNVGIGVSPTNYGTNYTNLDSQGLLGSYYTLSGTTSGIKVDIAADGGEGYIGTKTAHPFVFRTQDAERMRLTSAGEVLIATTTNGGIGGVSISPNSSTPTLTTIVNNTSVSSGEMQTFRHNNTQVGSITLNGTSGTLFNTSSDYRLKEDLQDFKGLDLVSKIPVYDYKWKVDESRSYGVMAHQLQEVLPQAVTGDKDAKEMQSVDYSKIVPLLVKSIQELKAEIELLKNK